MNPTASSVFPKIEELKLECRRILSSAWADDDDVLQKLEILAGGNDEVKCNLRNELLHLRRGFRPAVTVADLFVCRLRFEAALHMILPETLRSRETTAYHLVYGPAVRRAWQLALAEEQGTEFCEIDSRYSLVSEFSDRAGMALMRLTTRRQPPYPAFHVTDFASLLGVMRFFVASAKRSGDKIKTPSLAVVQETLKPGSPPEGPNGISHQVSDDASESASPIGASFCKEANVGIPAKRSCADDSASSDGEMDAAHQDKRCRRYTIASDSVDRTHLKRNSTEMSSARAPAEDDGDAQDGEEVEEDEDEDKDAEAKAGEGEAPEAQDDIRYESRTFHPDSDAFNARNATEVAKLLPTASLNAASKLVMNKEDWRTWANCPWVTLKFLDDLSR
jgi:hypothetical protein